MPIEGGLPSFAGATGWLNSEPVTPESLRGRPVVVQFWTFTCINWLRTLPYVRSWFEKYRADGLVVLGSHTPEFEVEHDLENVRRAAEEMRIDYPIAVDSDYRIWRAFGNETGRPSTSSMPRARFVTTNSARASTSTRRP